ncbi:hypothetical protein MycrhDRAFT_1180 [Mycolicibacterium rhodesiae JS60]|nr:hypothetical protein MycrhDRAFT_1180 [Mycolicibacterium rhodesiae JS60]
MSIVGSVISKAGALCVATALAVGTTVVLAPIAAAEPGTNPCELNVTFLCQFVPLAPELDGDVDLTQQPQNQVPAMLAPEDAPPAPVCARGCM